MIDFEKEVFIQPRTKVNIKTNNNILIKDICETIGRKEIVDKLENIEIDRTDNKEKMYIIPIMQVIKFIKNKYPDIMLEVINERDILINVYKGKNKNKVYEQIKVLIICIFVFVSSAVAIMNFHADVNMLKALQFFYMTITGEVVERPLLISIPYSFGVGVGMFIFFNHISLKERYRNKPSPLDLEIYSYENSLDEYLRNKARENGKNEL